MNPSQSQSAKFGTILGMAPGNVPVYSSDYDSADETEFPDRKAYRSFIDGIFMGYRYQCVELARRWLYINKQYIFDDIPMAYDIFRLRCVKRISDGQRLPLRSFKNGSRRRPEVGCLLIWDAAGEFSITGHVAIVAEVDDDFIRIIEQNVENRVWPEGQGFSRQLKAKTTEDGGYWIEPCLKNVSILGWVIQTDDETFAEKITPLDKGIFEPLLSAVKDTGQSLTEWIDTSDPAGQAYVAACGHALAEDPDNAHKYFCLSETAFSELKRATNELHHLFMRATEYVLQDDKLLHRFNIPASLWPRIHKSWDNRKNAMITGRLDFSISREGLKLYEYNADSASCYFETARLQAEWSSHFGCTTGRDPGEKLFDSLLHAWKTRDIDSVIHIMQDIDPEETYHALFMKSVMEKAGITAKVLKGFEGLARRDGNVIDAEGDPIRQVWKTWAWETAIDQVRRVMEQNNSNEFLLDSSSAPLLADVLLRPDVMVNEPLWTVITSNKAILPVMWMLFPEHPYLLNSQFELTDELKKTGYVEKPIVGRSGENIIIVGIDESIMRETEGRFGNRSRIYQGLFPLPRIDGINVQICSFSVAGSFAGACIRTDPSLVIKGGSDVMPLRIVSDDEYRRMKRGA